MYDALALYIWYCSLADVWQGAKETDISTTLRAPLFGKDYF